MTDGHEGLLAAVAELFSATPRQRCLVHKQRNVLNAIPRRERAEVAAELAGIWDQPTKEEAVTQLMAFKANLPCFSCRKSALSAVQVPNYRE